MRRPRARQRWRARGRLPVPSRARRAERDRGCHGHDASRLRRLLPHQGVTPVTLLSGKRPLAYCSVVGDVFKALADPTRRAILDELQERGAQTLFELINRLISRHGLSSTRQAVSQHLEVLEAAGLVRSRREGRYKFHDLDTSPLKAIVERWHID